MACKEYLSDERMSTFRGYLVSVRAIAHTAALGVLATAFLLTMNLEL